jgi:magnesium transporter
MFYQFDDDVTNISTNDISSDNLTMGYVNQKELSEIYKQLGISLKIVENCKECDDMLSSEIDIKDDCIFIKINAVNHNSIKSGKNCFGLLVRKNMLLLINISENSFSSRDIFISMLSKVSCENATTEKLLCLFFDQLISNDGKELKNAEIEINNLEEAVLKSKVDRNFNMRLLNMKKELLALRSYYEQLIDISEAIGENENEIFDSKEIKKLKIFTNKAIRLKENVDLLKSSVVHLWDAYQANLDMKLNQSMKVFTLMTTIFFPLTLIAGWYGMNFDYMPELHWRYGYAYVILLSVAVVTGLYLWFKRKKWL